MRLFKLVSIYKRLSAFEAKLDFVFHNRFFEKALPDAVFK